MMPVLRELLAERRRHRDAVEDRVDGDAREQLLLFERNAELVERRPDLGIDLVQAVQHLLLLRRRVVDDVLVVDRVVLDVLPGRLLHREPEPIRLQAPLEQPLRLLLLRGDQPDDVLVEALRDRLGLDVGVEAVLVFAGGELFDGFGGCGHDLSFQLRPVCASCRATGQRGEAATENEAPASARALRVRVVEDEAAADQARVVVERGAVDEPVALRIDEDFRAVRRPRTRGRRRGASLPRRTCSSTLNSRRL